MTFPLSHWQLSHNAKMTLMQMEPDTVYSSIELSFLTNSTMPAEIFRQLLIRDLIIPKTIASTHARQWQITKQGIQMAKQLRAELDASMRRHPAGKKLDQ